MRNAMELLGSTYPPAPADLRPTVDPPQMPRWDGPASQAAENTSHQLQITRNDLYDAHYSAAELITVTVEDEDDVLE